ncbi:hypothetical protein QFZ96_004418 [Paraburkholderia youngii]
MTSFFWSELVLLLIVAFVCGCFGFILGSFLSTSAPSDRDDPFLTPLPRQYAHECDAHYPCIGD